MTTVLFSIEGPRRLSVSFKVQLKSPLSNTFSLTTWLNTDVDKSLSNFTCCVWSFGAKIFKKISFHPSTSASAKMNLPFFVVIYVKSRFEQYDCASAVC